MLITPVDQQFVKICDHLAPHSKFTRPLGEDVLDSGSLVLPCSYRSSDGTFFVIAVQISHSFRPILKSKSVCMGPRSSNNSNFFLLPGKELQ